MNKPNDPIDPQYIADLLAPYERPVDPSYDYDRAAWLRHICVYDLVVRQMDDDAE